MIDEVRVDRLAMRPVPPAIAALASRQIDVRPLIGAEFALDDAEDRLSAPREGRNEGRREGS